MLDALRASSQTWIGRIIMAVVMGFLIIAFGFWGIADIFRGFGANKLAKIGSVEITTEAFRNAYQTQLLRLQQQRRRAISSDEAREMGLDRQVLGRMVDDAILDQEAHHMGLAMSDADLAKAIMADDAFKGPNGQFDRRTFEARLYDAGVTEQHFTATQRSDYLRQQLIGVLDNSLATPQEMLELINRYYNEVRAIDYIELPKSVAGTIPSPTDAQLKAYFDQHRAIYRTPEYRKVSVLVVTPKSLAQTLAKSEPVGEADVRKHYDAVKDQHYTEAEQRHVQQIVFPDEATATAASFKLAGGETFDALVAERKLTSKDIDLGTVKKSDLHDPAIASAAFSLAAGAVSKPVKTQFGWAIVRADKVMPGIVIPFAAVKDAIAAEIQLDRARNKIAKIHDQMEDQRTAGKNVADAAKSLGLEARKIDAIDAQGHDKNGQAVADLGDPQAALKAIFASDVGVDNDAISTRDGGSIWFDVLGIEPARAQSFDEVKQKVAAAWSEEETAKRLTAKADEFVQKINAGQALTAVAAAQGNLPVKHLNGIKRSESAGLSHEMLDQVFDRHVGTAGSAPGENGSRTLFTVASDKVPPLDVKQPYLHSILEQMKTALNEDMVAQYVTQLEGAIGVRINEQAYQSIVGARSEAP